MQKYNDFLVEQVRSGKAQIQVDGDSKWNDLVNHIFPQRPNVTGENGKTVNFNFYWCDPNHPDKYNYSGLGIALPIIQAKDFLVQDPEVNWVEVRDRDDMEWRKRILIADLGPRIVCRYAVVSGDREKDYISGGQVNSTVNYKFMRPIPQPESLTHSELEKLIGKPFKYVAE